jgi:N-acetylmuramic acid 6-phosphate etherase
MIDVQPTNNKLRDRARRILMDATGMAEDEATLLLTQAGNEVKTAIFMALSGLDAETARHHLGAARGHLRHALTAVLGEVSLA